MVYKQLPFPGFNTPVNNHQKNNQPKFPVVPTVFYCRQVIGKVGLIDYLPVQAPRQHNK